MSNVSASGLTPYFFSIMGSKKSHRGIKAEKETQFTKDALTSIMGNLRSVRLPRINELIE